MQQSRKVLNILIVVKKVAYGQTRLRATTVPGLYWWAGNGAVGTKHAAIARKGTQQRVAGGAFVEELAGIGRHGFGLSMVAVGAG